MTSSNLPQSPGWTAGTDAQLAFLLEYLPVGFFQVDGKEKLVEVKGSLWKELGINALTARGSNYQETFSVVKSLVEGIQRGLKGKTHKFEVNSANGLTFHAVVLPFIGMKGAIDGMVGAIMTQEKASTPGQPELHPDSLLRYFIEHSPASVAMFDREMNYLMVSKEYIRAYRVEGPLTGQNHYEVFPEVPERWKKVHQRCLLGVVESAESDPFPRNDGQVDYIDWVVAPWFTEANEVGGLIFYTNIVNDRVEGRLRLLQLNEQLQRSNQRLEDFALAVSHTLRDPLRQAIATGQRVMLKIGKQHEAEVDRDAEDWMNQLYRLEKIVAGLLDNAHLTEVDQYHPVDLNSVLVEVETNLAPLFERSKASLLHGVLPEVKANEFEMVALFQQLLANAIEYNQTGQVQVILNSEKLDNGFWQICVKDNGPGLNDEELTQLFSFARQLDVSRPRTPGVGLPVCKRIIEHMGGQMWAESTVGQGSSFFFTIPV